MIRVTGLRYLSKHRTSISVRFKYYYSCSIWFYLQPKVIISTNYGVEPKRVIEYKPMLDHAIELSAHKPKKVIMYKRKVEMDVGFLD